MKKVEESEVVEWLWIECVYSYSNGKFIKRGQEVRSSNHFFFTEIYVTKEGLLVSVQGKTEISVIK
jgi:hypothetical protein